MSGRRLGPGDAPESLGSILARVIAGLVPGNDDGGGGYGPPGASARRAPTIIFCSGCGSGAVDIVRRAAPGVPVLRCDGCGHEAHVPGFVLGRYHGEHADEVLRCARVDAAVCEVRAEDRPT
ncbi:hypothetical protein [Sorangium sp. So ce1000]|uniref:hypothetical protein n=1 Tax=Sorangium sp. So ce1000 TaxID=3133325 RepID=UPI003F5D894B